MPGKRYHWDNPGASVELTSAWKEYSYSATRSQNSTSMRLDFFAFGAPGEYWLANVSLTVQE